MNNNIEDLVEVTRNVRKNWRCDICRKGEENWEGVHTPFFWYRKTHRDCQDAEIFYNLEVLRKRLTDPYLAKLPLRWWPLKMIRFEMREWLEEKFPEVHDRLYTYAKKRTVRNAD